MKRLAAALALAAAATPLAAAPALPPDNRAVDCTVRHVVRETDVRDYLWCLSLRDS